ncbi:MAG: DUF421 domain-containing protein [Bacilli bacterium]|nr:DUF421 domain-containing protein [Bacilli bacterium]
MKKEMIDILDVIMRCLVSLLTLFLVTKMIGKKQVSQFSLFDYVIGISIGNFAAEMAINLDSSYLHGTVAVIVFGIVAYLVSYITMKSIKIRKYIIGDPNVLIKDGKILYNSLKKSKFDINDLLEEARINGYFDISDIDYALMEANGKISFLPKPESQSPTNKDLKIKTVKKGLCINLIVDGQIIEGALKDVKKTKNWIINEIKKRKIKLKDIMLATIDLNGNLIVYEKNVNDNTYTVLN